MKIMGDRRERIAEAQFGRSRFFVKSGDQESGRFMTYDFAKQLFDSLRDCGKDPAAFFEHENGDIEDFTEYFTH